jgi:hypothetical protein
MVREIEDEYLEEVSIDIWVFTETPPLALLG